MRALEIAPPAPSSGEESDHSLIPAYLGNETILVVDDEPLVRDLVAFVLERYGYTVIVASDGEDAVDIAERFKAPIHLVLTDVVMPRVDGCHLARDLRRWYPSIGVLMMSGHPEGTVAALAIDEEFFFFIRKPFEPSALVSAVRSALDWRPGQGKS